MHVDVLDLYAENFDPRLDRTERDAYYASDTVPAATALLAKQLTQASTLVLVFPTWWFGMPAMLKGWLDRVFFPGLAFEHASNFGPIKPKLTQLRNVVVITTLGSPWWVDCLVMRRPVRRILKKAVFALCAPQAGFSMFSLYAAENPPAAKVRSFTAKISKKLERIA